MPEVAVQLKLPNTRFNRKLNSKLYRDIEKGEETLKKIRPKTHFKTVKLPEGLHTTIKSIADEKETTITQYVIDAIMMKLYIEGYMDGTNSKQVTVSMHTFRKLYTKLCEK